MRFVLVAVTFAFAVLFAASEASADDGNWLIGKWWDQLGHTMEFTDDGIIESYPGHQGDLQRCTYAMRSDSIELTCENSPRAREGEPKITIDAYKKEDGKAVIFISGYGRVDLFRAQ